MGEFKIKPIRASRFRFAEACRSARSQRC